MTLEERLDNKYEEVLEERGELRERLELQEQALVAAEKVMDIFKYTIDGLKVQRVLMSEHSDGMLTFSVQGANGDFRGEYGLSEDLRKALEQANGYLARNVKEVMLVLLRKYFEIEPGEWKNVKIVIISIKN